MAGSENTTGGTITIGELAQRTGVATSALRFYEDRGLLEPTGRAGGRRVYDEAAVETVGAILFLGDVGFTLAEILALRTARSDDTAWRALIVDKLEEVQRKADELEAARVALVHASNCPADDITECPSFRAVVRDRLDHGVLRSSDRDHMVRR